MNRIVAPTADVLVEAVIAAEDAAHTAHLTGTCHLSEWSCSYCEAEGR